MIKQLLVLGTISICVLPAGTYAGSYGDGYGARCGFFETPDSPTTLMAVSVTESVWSKKNSVCREAFDVVEDYRLNNAQTSPWRCERERIRLGHSPKNEPVIQTQCSRKINLSGKSYKLIATGKPTAYTVSPDVQPPLQSLKWLSAGVQRSKLEIATTESAAVTVDHFVKCSGKKVSLQDRKRELEIQPGKAQVVSLYIDHDEGPAVRKQCGGKGYESLTNYIQVDVVGVTANTTVNMEF